MPSVNIKVYLNEGPDAFFPFDRATARLRKAAEFFEPMVGYVSPAEKSIEAMQTALDDEEAEARRLAEYIFEQLNVGGDIVPAADFTTVYREAGNRSLSVGDVVVIGRFAFAVGRFGWDRILNAEVRLGARRFDRLGADNRMYV